MDPSEVYLWVEGILCLNITSRSTERAREDPGVGLWLHGAAFTCCTEMWDSVLSTL